VITVRMLQIFIVFQVISEEKYFHTSPSEEVRELLTIDIRSAWYG